jgi:heme/copper-type cytochrome/quinol oxidase subunit 2
MHTWVDGWNWLWMTFMMGFWLVVLGAVIFIAVRLAQQPPHEAEGRRIKGPRRDRPLERSQT